MAVISLLGALFSSAVIYFLSSRRIRLTNCQNLLIVNVAVSDAVMSLAGFFRGLGIVDSKFVGAPAGTTTLTCAIYAMFVNTFACSGVLALLPLTLDRAVAVMFPLRHKEIVTERTCVVMFGVTWLPVFALLLSDTIAYTRGTVKIEYYKNYHRCVILGRDFLVQLVSLLLVPILLIVLLYVIMLLVIMRTRRTCGRFLATATGIIITSLLAYTPTAATATFNIRLNYELAQVLTVTVYYINGIINPVIYVATHPAALKYVRSFRSRWTRGTDSVLEQKVRFHGGIELPKEKSRTDEPMTLCSLPPQQDS